MAGLRPGRPARSRCGATRLGLLALLALALAAAGLLIAVFVLNGDGGARGGGQDARAATGERGALATRSAAAPSAGGGPGGGPGASPGASQGASQGDGATGASGSSRTGASGPGGAEAPEPSPARPLLRREERGGRDERYRGRGRIRGSVVVQSGGAPPPAWRIVLTPSLYLAGREFAVGREVEGPGGAEEFSVSDLPLGAYDLRAEAPGWNSTLQPVDLHAANRDPYVTLSLSPSGALDGQVVEEGGQPVPELPVTLAPLPHQPQLAQVQPETILTDAHGGFHFASVLDGEYELRYGRAQPPRLPSRKLAFSAPAMHLPPVTAPRLPALEVTVLDVVGVPVEGALVVVDGPGGQVRGTTGHDGRLRFALLGAGDNQVAAQHPDLGSGVKTLELPEAGLTSLEVEVAR